MKKNTVKVNEIFYSIQGEGTHTGMPAVFIRLSGCNLQCDYCDTQHQVGEDKTIEAILTAIKGYKCSNVVLTGGEPTIQENFRDLCNELFVANYNIYLETNGTTKLPEDIWVEWITVSPKGDPKDIKVSRIDELKVVYEGQPVDQWFSLDADFYFLQPCDRDTEQLANTFKTVLKVKEDPRWRMSTQIQKILKIR